MFSFFRIMEDPVTVNESSDSLENDTEFGLGFTAWIRVVRNGIRIGVAHNGTNESQQHL